MEGDPVVEQSSDLRHRAEELRRAARELRANALLGVRRLDGPDVWKGGPAEQFSVDLRRQEQRLLMAVDLLEANARRLLVEAEQAEWAEQCKAVQ